MNRLQDAKRASEEEYNTAKHLDLHKETCRAAGNLGMVNYQLYVETKDAELLDLAISQLNERIAIARKLKTVDIPRLKSLEAQAELQDFASQRESIALARLSLCYTEQNRLDEAISTAEAALQLTFTQDDPTKIAFSRFFYGRALFKAGKFAQALAQYNPVNECTPTIALCREPSDEHRQYIREMIHAGADMELRDDEGYSALDCAVYAGDEQTGAVIEEGLKLQYERRLERHRYEAVLRKAYREIIQETLRPVFLNSDERNAIGDLRRAYAAALQADPDKSRSFDGLKFVRYADFLRSGQIPRSSDKYTTHYTSASADEEAPAHIIFLSYRWLAKASTWIAKSDSPDDANKTQYKRMVRAVEEYLRVHPDVDRNTVGIWIDFACVDQTNHDTKEPGCAALLLNLAQCNAMISLTDEFYYQRSWCCVEVMMMQTVKKAYGIHRWYEHRYDNGTDKDTLVPGPMDLIIDMAEKQLTYEADRPSLMFLQRQTRLLG